MRQKRRTAIIEAATAVFARQGFEQTTMQEIANEAILGVATIFRYFPKKEHLIVEVAANIVHSEIEILQDVLHAEGTCYEKMERIFDTLVFYHQAHYQQNSKLIEAFECYVVLSKAPLENLQIYQDEYDQLIHLFTELAHLGERDGSVRTDMNTVDTLITMMNVFGNFSKKMSMLHDTDAFNTRVDLNQQFNILKTTFLSALKA